MNHGRHPSQWLPHLVRAGSHWSNSEDPPTPSDHTDNIEPWLSALFQSDHLNLLLGNGFTTAVASAADTESVQMRSVPLKQRYADAVEKVAKDSAARLGRETPNLEDEIRASIDLIAGLRVLQSVADLHTDRDSLPTLAGHLLSEWESALDSLLTDFLKQVLSVEQQIASTLRHTESQEQANRLRRLIGAFLLPFASRTATRERLHIFTVNYDRLIEYASDLLGLRLIDRFVGTLSPVFRSSRLGVDLHYNPPGIRGEPRYLEGVVRFTKLHGSVDWRCQIGASGRSEVQRCALPFGASKDHPEIPKHPSDTLLIYPNPAKDVETLEYPYADLFRDLAAATCQPNSVTVTYGYGFGDDHVNRVLRDMLSIPSTHLVIISRDLAGGRIPAFCDQTGREEQVTLLLGRHFGELETLVQHYLPKPAIDRTTWRMMNLLQRRTRPTGGSDSGGLESNSTAGRDFERYVDREEDR